MPMLDIEKRHADVFRIRIGDKDDQGNPRKLTDSIRITSHNRSVVEAFANVFGGDPRQWDSEWEVYVPGNSLPVMVLPGQSISQWWEFYKGSVCERRCDGFTEVKSGRPCMCPSTIEERLADKKKCCQPMTRINVVCPDVEVVGAGSLVTHSMVAAETLPQAVAIAEAALSHGLMVPAMLRVVEHVGKGKRYIVPQLEIVGVSLTQLQTGEVPRAAISARANLELEPPGDDIVGRAAPPIPDEDAPSPRGVDDASELVGLFNRLPSDKRGLLQKDWRKAGLPPSPDKMDDAQLARALLLARQWVALWLFETLGFGERERHAAVLEATGGATESTKRLSFDQLRAVSEWVAERAAKNEEPFT